MIESVGCENTIISLLYVSDDEKEWEYERLEEDYIAALGEAPGLEGSLLGRYRIPSGLDYRRTVWEECMMVSNIVDLVRKL